MPHSKKPLPASGEFHAFAIPPNGNGPKRSPEALEALLEEVVAKQVRQDTTQERIEDLLIETKALATALVARADLHAKLLGKVHDEHVEDRRVVGAKLDMLLGLVRKISEPPQPLHEPETVADIEQKLCAALHVDPIPAPPPSSGPKT